MARLGGLREADTLELTLGPKDAVGANEFLVVDDENNMFTGTFTSDDRGNVTIMGNAAEFETLLTQLAEAEIEDATNIIVDVTAMKMTAKVKVGVSLKRCVQIKFDIQGTMDGQFVESRGSYTVSGRACPK